MAPRRHWRMHGTTRRKNNSFPKIGTPLVVRTKTKPPSDVRDWVAGIISPRSRATFVFAGRTNLAVDTLPAPANQSSGRRHGVHFDVGVDGAGIQQRNAGPPRRQVGNVIEQQGRRARGLGRRERDSSGDRVRVGDKTSQSAPFLALESNRLENYLRD